MVVFGRPYEDDQGLPYMRKIQRYDETRCLMCWVNSATLSRTWDAIIRIAPYSAHGIGNCMAL